MFWHIQSVFTRHSYSLCREIFHGDIDLEDLPAHVYLHSVHNISIERSWLRLRLEWGDNAVLVFNKGVDDGIYNPNNTNQ